MTDYLSTGGIRSPDILVNAPRAGGREQPASKDELYLEGYGRQFGEKMTYSVGLTYGLGLLSGGFYGGMLGVRQGGATSKLFLNSVLNSSTRYGPALGNQSAIITMFYVSFHSLISWVRDEDDVLNAASAGMLAGGFYKIAARSWQPVAKYSAVSAGVFAGLDTLVAKGTCERVPAPCPPSWAALACMWGAHVEAAVRNGWNCAGCAARGAARGPLDVGGR
eukprot:CAMPEP_0183433758 /NCGR_PEP_ID=MMETSP0370-20130417/61595_1 /TAXON_ID=268820 /ORGANISM="Peridinium aciculiferum, Strain PAER-2" /LENGTH=220 /DNA_ID=CAMNT_0025620171 /DNA_START=99 /DNA_END=759 /DNA_ORIENTATION=-